ncbi:carboxypeptidase regulatory-like domain-containing protein [Sphingomonas oryzagri]
MRQKDRRTGFARSISAIALCTALVVARPAYAANDTGTIQGHVTGAPAGAKVIATDAVTGQRVTSTINASGNYIFVGMRPSTYRVQLENGAPQDITLPVGQTATLDINTGTAPGGSSTGTKGGEIVVKGVRARNEVRTAEVATNVSQLQINTLPQNDRNFLNFAALAPGVAVSTNPSSKQIQAGGVSSDNVNVYIDGESFKNQNGHGGVAGQSFSQGNPFPQSAVQEFKVDTQNFKAEYDQAGSAIINAVTKTGGTSFHGDAFGEFMPKSFFGRDKLGRAGHPNNPDGSIPKPDYKRWQYGADLGGPIIKDVLHFFVAYEGTTQQNPAQNVTFTSPFIPASVVAAGQGQFADPFKQDLWFGKLTLFASDKDTFNLSVFDRSESNHTDYGGTSVQSHGHDLRVTTRQYLLQYNHRGDRWLNEFSVSYQKQRTGTPNLTDGPEIDLVTGGILVDDNGHAILGGNGQFQPQTGNTAVGIGGTVAQLGANSFQQDSRQKFLTFKDNITFFGDGHVIKAGIKFNHAKFAREESYFADGAYFFNAADFQNGTCTATPACQPVGAQIATQPPRSASATDNQLGIFIQDDWTVNDHLTVNYGLRWDYESNMFNYNFVTPANIVTALNNYPGWKAAGINPADYISTGKNRKPYLKAFQPRLGVSYDWNGDRDIVIFAGAGRYYDRNLFTTGQIETLTDTVRSDTQIVFGGKCGANQSVNVPQFDPSFYDVETLRGIAASCNQGGSVWLLPNKTKVPYTDQFDFGIRKRFGKIQTAITFAHNESRHIFAYQRGNRLPDGSYTSQGDRWVEDNFPAEGQLPGFNGKLNIGAFTGKAHYDAIYLTVNKDYNEQDGWGFTLSGTLADAKSNAAIEQGSDEFFSGPDMRQFGWQNVAGIDKYRLVATGIVRLPWDVKFSATGTFASGPSFGSVKFPANPPENASAVVNLGGVYWPKYPFAYKNLDLRLEKKFKMPWGHELTMDAEVFNVFDTLNRAYSAWGAGNGTPAPRIENSFTGNPPARSFQVGLKYSF